jgi:hypothetical protein
MNQYNIIGRTAYMMAVVAKIPMQTTKLNHIKSLEQNNSIIKNPPITITYILI